MVRSHRKWKPRRTFWNPAKPNAIYTSDDGGATWSATSTAEDIPCEITLVQSDGITTVLARTNCDELFISTSSATSWVQVQDLPPGMRTGSIVRAGKNLYLTGQAYENGLVRKRIYCSYDGGEHWKAEKLHFEEQDHLGNLVFRSPLLLTVKNNRVLLKHTASRKWIPAAGLDQADILRNALLYANNYRLFLCGDGGIYTSADGGFNWEGISSGLQTTPFITDGVFAAGNSIMTSLAAATGLICSDDGGQTWRFSNLAGKVRCVIETPNGLFAAVARSGKATLHRSTDAGQSWTIPNSNIPESTTFYTLASFGNYLYAGTNAAVMVSADGGHNWTLWNTEEIAGNPAITSLAHDPANRTMYAGTPFSGVFRFVKKQPSAVQIGPDIGATALMRVGRALFAFNGKELSRQLSPDLEWTTVKHPTMSALNTQPGVVLLMERGNLLLASSGGVLRSANMGQTFESWNEGLPTLGMGEANKVLSFSRSGAHLYALTAQKKVYRRSISDLPIPPVSIGDDNEKADLLSITASPNPVVDEVVLHLAEWKTTESAQVHVINAWGQVVEVRSVPALNNGALTLSLGNQPPGLYRIRLSNGQQSTSVNIAKSGNGH